MNRSGGKMTATSSGDRESSEEKTGTVPWLPIIFLPFPADNSIEDGGAGLKIIKCDVKRGYFYPKLTFNSGDNLKNIQRVNESVFKYCGVWINRNVFIKKWFNYFNNLLDGFLVTHMQSDRFTLMLRFG